MALKLKACVREECDGLSFSDTTRNYEVDDNPGGYGVANVITSPGFFDTYTFSFWDPTKDPATDAATAVINLLTNLPTQSADQDYDWATFLFADLNVTIIQSGVGYIEVVGVKDAIEYRNDFTVIFTKELYDILKVKMAAWRPGLSQKQGCMPIQDLWNALNDVMCGGVCSDEQATDVIKWIRSNLNNICC